MISERLLASDEADEVLKKAGYEPASSTLEGHQCWRSPGGLHLLVPLLPPDGMVCERVLMERMAEVDAADRLRSH